MSPDSPAMLPAGPVSDWLDAAAVLGPISTPGDSLRSAIFDVVREQRDGPVAERLFVLAGHPDPQVRYKTVDLLRDLSSHSAWPRATEVAARRLPDTDERVRRAAAWLLAEVGGIAAVACVLTDEEHPADPVARIALTEAVLGYSISETTDARRELAARLRSDREPAVRLVASLVLLGKAGPVEQSELEAAIRADLPIGADRLAGPGGSTGRGAGGRWAVALARLGRPEDCYQRVAELLDPAQPVAARQAGIEMARETMREWRAAPQHLAPLIIPVLTAAPGVVGASAAEALSESLTATRLSADHLVACLDAPGLQEPAAVGLGRIGHVRALPVLCRILDKDPRTWPYGLGEAFIGLVESGADPKAVVTAMRGSLSRHRAPCDQGRICSLLLAASVLARLGTAAEAALPELTSALRTAAEHGHGTSLLTQALGALGPAAGPAVPILQSLLAAGRCDSESAALALTRITGDRRYADAARAAVPDNARRYYYRVGPELLEWLSDHGGLTERQTTQLHRFFDQRGPMQLRTAHLVWRNDGATKTGILLEVLPDYLDDDCCSPYALKTLTAMGGAALPAVPALDAIINRDRRLPFYIGDFDAEMRADERLVARTREARDLILGYRTEVDHV